MEIYELTEAVLQLPADLRAEVIAREIIEEGLFSLDNTHIVPQGIFRRSYCREVSGITGQQHADGMDYVSVKIGTVREGISDMLPPGIIHQPVINREERTAEVMIKEAEFHAAEFNHARTFFQPVDIEFGRQRISLEQFEHESVTDTYAYYGEQLYSYLWPDLGLTLTPSQKASLLELTIHVHREVGDYEACSHYLAKLLGQKVQIRTGADAGLVMDDMPGLAGLGKSILGVDWIPFAPFPDHEYIRIIVGPVPVTEMINFRAHEPLGQQYRLLVFLCDLLLPVEISWTMVLVPSEGDFKINKGEETGVLGYTTVLE